MDVLRGVACLGMRPLLEQTENQLGLGGARALAVALEKMTGIQLLELVNYEPVEFPS